MRLAKEANNLQTGNTEAEGIFKIKATGKAFRILIDGLYSDKIQSIVRELAANAFDSHKEMGTDANFFVHGPNALRPEFYVRDYGVGMTHEKVMSLYSTLFDSDKDSTNDFVGMFGLGSKSPFAYTDQFCVTCYDGVYARHYGAGVGKGGIPQIILLQTEPCSEPLGVRVSFSVDAKDFDAFNAAIRRVSLGFDSGFETNVTDLPKRGVVSLEGTGWRSYYHGQLPAQFSVRQGCVIYPLEKIGGVVLPTDGYQRQYLIEAPIGTVEVTSSREKIAYSPKVVKYLNERLELLKKEVPELIRDKLKDVRYPAEFFTSLESLRPQFARHETFTHIPTGLTANEVWTKAPGRIMTVSYVQKNARWEYDIRTSVTCELPSKDDAKTEVLEIKDMGPLLDVIREDGEKISLREHRRISRLIRAYLEFKQIDRMTFWLGLDWSDEFAALVQPNVTRTQLAFEDLIDVVPTRRGRLPKKAIRGLVTLTGESHEQRPVMEIDGDPAKSAWIKADELRRENTSIRQLARAFDIEVLYIANSTAYEAIKASPIPHLTDALNAKLKEQKGISWDDWSTLQLQYESYPYNPCDCLLQFGVNLQKDAPKSFEKLIASKTLPGDILKLLRPYIEKGLIEFGVRDRHQPAMRVLNTAPKGGESRPLKIDKRLQQFIAIKRQFGNKIREASPSILFLQHARYAKTKEQFDAATKAMISLFRIIPPTMNWSPY